MSAVIVETRPTVKSIVAEFWQKLRTAEPTFNLPAPTTAEGAILCIGLVMDWTLETEARWMEFGWLHREATATLVALEEAARFEPVGEEVGSGA